MHVFKKLYEHQLTAWILLAVLLIPLLFINTGTTHDWGDDFAQYIVQAKDLINQSRINPNDKVLDINNYSPTYKGTGFSLLITPLYYYFNIAIKPYILLISLTLIGACMVLYSFYKHRFALSTSILMVLAFAYNYHVLNFKMEIMPEFLFILLLFSCLQLYKQSSFKSIILLGILTGLLISVKTIGWVFYFVLIGSYIFHIIKRYIHHEPIKINILKGITLRVLPILIYFLIDFIFFHNHFSNTVIWYKSYFNIHQFSNTFHSNVSYYLYIYKLLFEQEVWGFANVIIKFSLFILLFIGIGHKWYKHFTIMDAFVIVYMLILMVYPYRGAGIRFLIVVLPFFVFYFIDGLTYVFELIKLNKTIFLNLFLILLITSNFINIRNMLAEQPPVNNGPQSIESVEAFNYINTHIPKQKIIAFNKPWVMYLYTGHPSVLIRDMDDLLIKRVDYILTSIDSTHSELMNDSTIIGLNNIKYIISIWKNHSFELFLYKTHLKNN